jgi:hypothetical protein
MLVRAPSPLRPQIGEAELLAWFLAASPGDRIAYWRGHLAIDLAPTSSPLSQNERRRLRGLKNMTLSMAETGLLHLVQQRLGLDDYLYLAIARPRPRQGSARLILPGLSPQAASSLPQAA